MNDRIRELMEQVVRIEIDPDSNCETIYTCGPEEFLAFAQLIVKDCLRFVEVGRDKTDIRHLITACFLMNEEQE